MERNENYIHDVVTAEAETIDDRININLSNTKADVYAPTEQLTVTERARMIMEECDAHDALDVLRVVLGSTYDKLCSYMNWGQSIAITGSIESGDMRVQMFDMEDIGSNPTGSYVNCVKL